MKKLLFLYMPLLLLGLLLSFGAYIVISWAILNYKLWREEGIHVEVSLVANNASNTEISRMLFDQWLSEFKKDVYVENKIEAYMLHDLVLEEEHDTHFIFSGRYSIITDNPDTAWKNGPHVEHDGMLSFDRKFRVNKVGNKYYFRIVSDEIDVDFAK